MCPKHSNMLTYLNCYLLNMKNYVSAGKNRTLSNCHFSSESESVRKTVKCLHWLSTRSNGSQRVSAAVESKRCQLDPSRRHPYCKSCPQRHSHLQRQLTPQLRTDHFLGKKSSSELLLPIRACLTFTHCSKGAVNKRYLSTGEKTTNTQTVMPF